MMSSTLCTTLLMLLPLLFVQAPDRESIDTLIKKLGSPHFRERENATQKLLEKMPQAKRALRRALRSPDLDIAQRARLILDEFARRPWKRPLQRLKYFVDEKKFDLATELLVRWPKGKYDGNCWLEVCSMTDELSKSFRQPANAVGAWVDKFRGTKPILIKENRFTECKRDRNALLFVRANEVDLGKQSHGWSGAVMLVTGDVRVSRSRFLWSAVYACGAVRVRGTNGVIIVADGPINLDGFGANNSIIISRDKVICQDRPSNCLIISGKTVVFKHGLPTDCTIIENESNPLGFIKFFNPTKEGITVAQAKNSVRIKQLAATKPYAKAGLQNGDVITNINGAKITSPENFRRVLRKHVAWEEEMTFRIRRDGKELQIKLRPLVLP